MAIFELRWLHLPLTPAVIVAFDGDDIDRAVKAHPEDLDVAGRFTDRGQPSATDIFFRMDRSQREGKRNRRPPPKATPQKMKAIPNEPACSTTRRHR